MAPSRGLHTLAREVVNLNTRDFIRSVVSPRPKAYISKSNNPYLNLAIEHYLLTKSSKDSHVLFLYRNRPSIILGRNQNPWVEVDLAFRLNKWTELPVDLVRRRSGGGTVFHDLGNVNYSVICPTAQFDRDKHAEMVVRALEKLDISGVLVNERHDIVQKEEAHNHRSKGDKEFEEAILKRFSKPSSSPTSKVSGSAYKLNRDRSLHHGTCLLSSPNLDVIPNFLHSPLKPFVEARGVESVSSKIKNLGIEDKSAFETSVVDEFTELYGPPLLAHVNEDMLQVPDVKNGYDELMSRDWILGQTPQFTFTLDRKVMEAAGFRVPSWFPFDAFFKFTARNGVFTEVSISTGDSGDPSESSSYHATEQAMLGSKVHSISDWEATIIKNVPPQNRGPVIRTISRMMNELNGGLNLNRVPLVQKVSGMRSAYVEGSNRQLQREDEIARSETRR